MQQGQEQMVRERQARLSVAESNMHLLVARMDEEAAQAAQHSRCAHGVYPIHWHQWTALHATYVLQEVIKPYWAVCPHALISCVNLAILTK